ncbi:MAG: PD40 domain-containing protein [Candidatus Eisenbacteria bacterium]|nr:PD40 domain-containing protein [Candidatus Eisenbacteria bacterium]
MKRIAALPTIGFLLLSAVAFAVAGEVRFVQNPEISPDGTLIAFSYDGDIWTVPVDGGEATRITDHVGWDGYPIWSPDGARIAFASDREGNSDVWIVPAAGGAAVRVTFHSSTDIPCDWTPDGASILFMTRRNGAEDLWLAPATGGTPVRVSGVWLEREAYADISNDGTRLVYNNNRATSGWWRRNFHSSDAADIYLSDFDPPRGIRPRPLTEDPVHELWPRFSPDDSEIYYAGGARGTLNVYRMPSAGGGATRVTSFEHDVTWLSMPARGDRFLVLSDFDVWTVPLRGGEPRRVPIVCRTEYKSSPSRVEEFSGGVSEFRVSPDGKKALVVVHGELFVVPAEKGGTARRITRTLWREADVEWLPDSRRVVYCSDRDGPQDLYIADTKTGEETRLTSGDAIDTNPLPSPDGEWIAFYRGNHAIWRIKPDGGEPEEMVRADFLDFRLSPTREFAWSPDSRWLAYAAYAPDFHTDVRVRNVGSGEDHAVSYLPTENHRPVWSPDGKWLYFTSWFQENGDTYRVRLRGKPPKFEEDRLDSLYEDEEKDKDKKDKKKDKDDAGDDEEPSPVEIDFADIDLRVEAFPDLANDESEPVFVDGGDRVVFAADVLGASSHDLWAFPADEDAEERKLEQLTSTSSRKSRLQAVEEKVWYLEGGRVKWYDTGKSKPGALSFRAEMEIDDEEDRLQMFTEAWSLLNDQFYDPAFHGAAWDEARERYGAVLSDARTPKEFETLVRMMIGELSASHLDIWKNSPEAYETGYLGLELDWPLLTEKGAYRVASVLPESPASLEESRIEPGEFLLSVDGRPLDRGTDLYALLERTVGRRVEIEVAKGEGGKGKRTVRIQPVGRRRILALKQEEWDRERERMVEEWSGGRLAYLHIRSMGGGDLERFRRQLVTVAADKDGAVIDVRYNGGGWIAVHVLGILEREQFLLRTFRGTPPISETKMRSYAWEKPTACLINNHSYSNAEIFAEGFRRLGLGPIVGIPTAGSVIGTGGWTLIDGTNFRKPSWGAYTIDGENLENNGRAPDFYVYNDYKDWMDGRDPQLKKAVEELMKTLQ